MSRSKNAASAIKRHAGPLLGFIVGIVATAGVGGVFLYGHAPPAFRLLRESDIASSTDYTLTDPLIGLASNADNPSPEYAHLEQAVASYIKQQNINGLSSASVNFKDILQSEGFTLNPDELYDPASLTKIPLMMAYYALAEQNPSVLSDEIYYSGSPDYDAAEQIPSPVQLMPGQSYNVEEMLEHMIEHSDNNAEQLLADHLAAINQLGVLATLFTDLGIKNNDPNNGDYVTAQEYSIFLRVLYNATYLDRDYSEKALSLLAQSDFTAGIVSGVTSGTVVAQKYGDVRVADSAGVITGAELQDCGIIYYPNHPYLLCVMTKGGNVKDLETAIAGISKLIFEGIEQRYPQTS